MHAKKFIFFMIFSSIFMNLSAQEYVEAFDDTDHYIEIKESDEYIPYSNTEIERQAEMAAAASGNVDPQKAIMTSTSYVNWTKNTFSSDISLNIERANIPMPSGKANAVKSIEMKLPVLVKDPLLSIYVDSSKTLGDLVLEGTMTLENLTRIIDNSTQTPAAFANGGENLLTRHTIKLQDIASNLIKHKNPYTPRLPVDTIASKAYTGIVIDARGVFPIHGEFTDSKVYPCLFPKIYSEEMELIYERNMVYSPIAKREGIVHYDSTDKTSEYGRKAGKTPLWITARKVFGINRCDVIISRDDYLRIVSVPENLDLLKKGKVVILLDKDTLEHKVPAPQKNKNYYIAYTQLKKIFKEAEIPDVLLNDTLPGVQITMQNLNFIADSAELLPQDKKRIDTVAEGIKEFLKKGDFTILVEGHTADVNKPNGQMQLSIERAQSIINLLVGCGIDKELFSFRGYGGTKPVANNKTDKGRAANRRVEIIILPKNSYLQTN